MQLKVFILPIKNLTVTATFTGSTLGLCAKSSSPRPVRANFSPTIRSAFSSMRS